MNNATHDDDLCFTSAVELAQAIRKRDLSPVELLDAVLARMKRLDPKINCLVTIAEEQARHQAKHAEQVLMDTPVDELPVLHGIPVTVKDLEDTAGVRTTYGSRNHAENVPTVDSPIWARMKAAGAILVAKTTTPEFGCHGITESLLTGITNNPWDVSRTTGGSSGGAAAAVASGFCPLATGSDGGGSIRVPSSFCGVVGLKPSVGRIAYNTYENAYESVVVVGPITRTVRDNALMLDVTAGEYPYDAIALPKPDINYLDVVRHASVKGLRIAYCPNLDNGPADPEVISVVERAAAKFERDLGATVEVVKLDLPDPVDYFKAWWGPEFYSIYEDNFLSFGKPENIPAHLPIIAEWGAKLDLAMYTKVRTEVRSRIHTTFAEIFEKYDLLIWPTTPVVAFPHPGVAGGMTHVNGIPVREPLLDNQRFTEAVSHAGYPAISVPAGFTNLGLPVGLQIAARHGRDDSVLAAAAAFEQAAPWAAIRPCL
ncbi:amidase [Pantoea sp. Ap-967]|uniref:amidase n=1 Tax=Pantoea sp. Ap-967 TaxID=2608362 RepID=UPI0014228AA0|nr:amidase [Pantoea sp. Ap-967]NIE72959.1 amidase [Pantoea sp. Ap-967]